MSFEQALQIFGLTSLVGQTEASLKKLYYQLAQKFHPDKGGTFKQFVSLKEAHLLLKQKLSNRFEEASFGHSGPDMSAYSSNWSGLEIKLKKQLEDLIRLVGKYENIFNNQIGIINQSNTNISFLIKDYQQSKALLREMYEQKLSSLKKNYVRTWWEYLLPVWKLSKEQYITQNNQLVARFNLEDQEIDDKFVASMLRMYQESYQNLVDLLIDI